MFEHDWTETSLRPIIDTALEQFTSERTMFGSNFPVDSITSTYDALVQAYSNSVDEVHHAALFGGTAKAFYSIQSRKLGLD